MNKDTKGIPVYDGKPLDAEDIRLRNIFDEIKKEQLTFIDQTGKRIIELSTGMLSLLFAISAFGNNFPPPYIRINSNSQWLVVTVLAAFILALLFGVLTVQPFRYDYYESNLTRMEKELVKILTYKSVRMKIAMWSFFVGTLLLAILVGALILMA